MQAMVIAASKDWQRLGPCWEAWEAQSFSKQEESSRRCQEGRVLQKIGEWQQAREVFGQGIAACNRVGDLHARSELQAAVGELSGA